MSIARSNFLEDVRGIEEAVQLDPVSRGASTPAGNQGVAVLRRGILITSLITIERFVRDRTNELLHELGRWPARYQDLPVKLRDAAQLRSLSYLQRYAEMLRRQGDDYEEELQREISRMAKTVQSPIGFTRFITGDHTGNISDQSIKEILSMFQITDCWKSFREFSSEIGFGVPSVHETLRDIIRKRHRSAHSPNYYPTASDVSGIHRDILCIGICYDVSMTATIEQAVVNWERWRDGSCNWQDNVDAYLVYPANKNYKLKKIGSKRAIRFLESADDARKYTPLSNSGRISVLITSSDTARPTSWQIL